LRLFHFSKCNELFVLSRLKRWWNTKEAVKNSTSFFYIILSPLNAKPI
jgi:hypothetical protein